MKMRNMMMCVIVAFAATVVVADDAHLLNTAFDEYSDGKPVGWQLTPNMRIGSGFGHNGSGGLSWSSEKPSEKLETAQQDVTGFNKGDELRFSALVKKEDFKSGKYGARVTVELRDTDDKWIAALYSKMDKADKEKAGSGEWVLVKGGGVLPKNIGSVRFAIHVAAGSSGSLAVDNIVLERVEAKPVSFVTSAAYQDLATDGSVRFHAALETPAALVGKAQATFVWKDTDGKTIRTPAGTLTADEASVTLDVGRFAPGAQPVACELASGGRTLGAATMTFTRVAELPKRRVWIDEHRRCIVDGKPFFPIGIYAYPSDANLGFFTNGAFNTIIHYKLADRALLDKCAARGIMSFSAFDRKMPKDELARRIAEISDHPALLGWYVGDELQASSIPKQIEYYDLIRTADRGQHPAYAVQDRTYDLRGFVRTADVIGLDVYPVAQRPLRLVTDRMVEGRKAVFDARTFWNVPQTFNWAWYRPETKDRERFPTEAEMRSMIWQNIAAGSNGIVSYNLRGETWAYLDSLLKVHRELAGMADVLLSVETAPKAMPDTADASCRMWVKDGKAYLLVCNLSDKQLDAAVTLDSGAWRVCGVEIGTSATMKDAQTAAFRLDPIGVSLVRLECLPTESSVRED